MPRKTKFIWRIKEAMKEATTQELTTAIGATPVFKVCRLGSRDGIFSVLAGKYGNCKDYARITYGQGKVSEDKDGSGIFIYLTKERALDQAAKFPTDGKQTKAVFEAVCLTPIIRIPGKENSAKVKKLMLGTKIWTGKSVPAPPPPPKTWKAVPTSELKVELMTVTGLWIKLSHKGTTIAHIGTNGVVMVNDAYKVTITRTSGIAHEFKVEKFG